ncbi:hypothetical protein NQ314_001690, partial [Rhamnusium bicolor]
STVTQCYSETTTIQSDVPGEKALKKKKSKKSRKEEKENISVNGLDNVEGQNFYNVNVKNLCRSFGDLTKIDEDRHSNRLIKKSGKSSFSKFDALQKQNVIHVRSSDSTKAQEKFNRKYLLEFIYFILSYRVETYVSHEGNLYCKPHFKSLFAPKVVEDEAPPRHRKPELIIRENQPLELPPGVVRASDKPDLGLEELQSLNVKERFQVFEHHQSEVQESDRGTTPINVKRSPSILSKLARFQAKGMDVGVSDEALNGIPIEESSSEEEEEEEEVPEGEDPTLYKARKVQKEKPFHFTNLSEVKNKWEHGEQNNKDERREERKHEIQTIRNRLFMGKQGKMKEAYQQAVMQSESCANLAKSERIESCDTKSLKERFEKGEPFIEKEIKAGEDEEDTEVFQSELDANASKAPQISPVIPQKLDVKKAREAYLAKASSEDTIKSSEVMEDVVEVKTADIQQRFKFFETYKEPEKQRKQFRITPPRDPSQTETPDREIYHDPDVIRADDGYVDDSVIAKTTHTASKMLNKFRQMEENLSKDPEPAGPKPLKRFTPPPEPTRPESSSEEESGSEEEESDDEDQVDNQKVPDDLLEAQKAARAKQLRAKFEKWEAQEIKKEQTNTVNIVEEYGEESQIESTKATSLRIVENEEWKSFFKSLRPTFHLPSRYDLSNTLLNEEYNRIKLEVELKIKEANHLSIQCDDWSNIRNEGIINFMITSPSPLFIKSVETKTEKHTSEYIASLLEEILLEYDVKKFLVLIIDNAPNMRKATKVLETKYPHLTVGVTEEIKTNRLHLDRKDYEKKHTSDSETTEESWHSSLLEDSDNDIDLAKSPSLDEELRARFESLRDSSSDKTRTPRVKVNRFVVSTYFVRKCNLFFCL